MRYVPLVIGLLAAQAFTPRQREVDMEHLTLRVRFDALKGQVYGLVTHRFRGLRPGVDSLVLDAVNLQIESVTYHEKPLPNQYDGQKLILRFPAPLAVGTLDSVTIRYTAQPRRGIYFIGWKDKTGRARRQIWTQGQATDHRYWIPAYDDPNDKLITETYITFDSRYQVLSNGLLVDTLRNPDGTLTWHYKMPKPHSLYLLMLAIGEYSIERRTTSRGTPLNLYYYPDKRACCLEPTYRYSVEMMEFLEDEIGLPFPWPQYSQVPVADYIYGAMENTTATVFGDFFQVDDRAFLDRNYVEVNAHELTHQWFGDYVTARNSAHIWLQESFATHYARRFIGHIYGKDAYDWGRRTEHTVALSASEKDNLCVVHPNAGYARVYQKGSAILDMMRHTFGNETYRQVIRYYLQKHPYDVVETNDLYQAFQDAAGLSPDWFFTQWLYRGGEPHYKVAYATIQKSGKSFTQVIVEQIQDTSIGLFKMPIPLVVYYGDGSRDSVRPWISEARQVIEIPNPQNKPVGFVLFDPGGWILKRVTFEKRPEELFAQLERAPDLLDRYDALVALRRLPAEAKREALQTAYKRERFWAIRAEIVAQLANDPKSQDFIRDALRDPHSQVRFAVIANLNPISTSLLPDLEKLLRDSSYTVVTLALERLSEAFPRRVPAFLQAVRGVEGHPGRQVEIKALEIAVRTGDRSALEKLVDYASLSFEFRTRQNALRVLKRLNQMPPSLLPHLFDALVSTNARLAAVAREITEYWMEQTLFRQTLQNYYEKTLWTPEEKRLLAPLMEYRPPTFYQRSS